MENNPKQPSGKLIVSAQDAGSRVDVFLANCDASMSRREARLACKDGRVWRNGRSVKPGALLEEGDVVEFQKIQSSAASEILGAEYLKTHREWKPIFEDSHLLLVRKPRGMSSIRLRDDDPVTLADIVAAFVPGIISASSDPREAGLVQRLDYYTSGMLIACKHRGVWDRLHEQLVEGIIEKTYLALVEGVPKKSEWTVSAPLESASGGIKMKVSVDGQEAESFVTVLKTFPNNIAVVRVHSRNTKRHQVRVHLAASGHVLIGDSLYDSKKSLLGVFDAFAYPKNEKQFLEENWDEGFLLQAESIRFFHPETHEAMNFCEQGEIFSWLLQNN